MNTSTTLWYDHPAGKWTDALPLGNGSLGAMVYGRCVEEIVSLNLDTLWSGRPHAEEDEDQYAIYRQVQQLAEEGKFPEAQKLIEEKFLKKDGNRYLPLGDLNMAFSEEGKVSGYTRSLDLQTAIHTVEYDRAGTRIDPPVHIVRESFVSYPDQALVLHIAANAPVRLKLTLSSQLRHSSYTENGLLLLDGECPGALKNYRAVFAEETGGILMRVACGVKTDGNMRCHGATILLEGATEITICLAAEDSFNGFDKDPVREGKEYRQVAVARVQSALQKEYDALRQTHIDDHSALFSRVSLDLGETENGKLPTDQRLHAHEKEAPDLSLYTLLFNYARYLAIAGSRPGSQPMNLQGIWNERLFAPWASNYTTNINTEMNYWPLLPANLAELTEPLTRMVRELSVAGRTTAQKLYHAEGWTCHHNTDLWRQTFPASGCAQWGFWYNGGGWLIRHVYDQYLYTMDQDFLRETVWPLLSGCARFYLSLFTEDEQGRLILCPSTSPENKYLMPDDTACSVSRTTTMTMSIAREVLENALNCLKKLHVDEELAARIEQVLPRLLPLQIGADGRLMEWYDDMPDSEIHHRHVSHLYALHPAHQITCEDTPELAEACKKTLNMRGDDGTGWSLAWKINFWARLQEGDHALRLLDNQLRFVSNEVRRDSAAYTDGGGTYANLFDAHPPFQIDGNFGAASGILEMLLQAREGRLHLLPALPSRWANGSVRGLKAPGNIAVDFAWQGGKLTEACLTSPIAQTLRVVMDGRETLVSLQANQPWVYRA